MRATTASRSSSPTARSSARRWRRPRPAPPAPLPPRGLPPPDARGVILWYRGHMRRDRLGARLVGMGLCIALLVGTLPLRVRAASAQSTEEEAKAHYKNGEQFYL